MPTRSGWLLGVSSALTGVGGRLLGLTELYVIAAGGVALLLCAVAHVWLRRFRVKGRRRLSPARLPVGGSCRVDLTLRNPGRRRTPALGVDDGSDGRFLLAPLGPGEAADVVYPLLARQRGVRSVGPLRASLRDPFGLAVRTVTVLAPGTLTVHPRVEHVALPPDPPGPPVTGSPGPRTMSTRAGDDFHALRTYEVGDDPRLIHWPSSARLDTLVVRQAEAPRLRRTTVALDLRHSVHDAVSLEQAVSAAAGLVAAACDEDGLVRLLTTGGADSGSAGGGAHLESVLDLLATVGADAGAGLRTLTPALGDGDGAAVVVITTTAASADDLGLIARLRPHSPLMVAVLIEPAAGRQTPHVACRASFDRIVMVPPGAPFGASWARSMAAVSAPG